MSTPRPRWRRWLIGAARLAVAAALLTWVFSRVDPGDAWAEMVAAPRWIWPSVSVLFIVSGGLYAARVLALMPGEPPAGAVLRAVLISSFAGIALPSGGAEVVRVVILGPYAGGADRALAYIAAGRLIELVIWGGLVAWAAAGVLPAHLPALVPIAWLVAAGFILGAPILAYLIRHGVGAARRLPGRLGTFAAGAAAPFAELAGQPRRLLHAALMTALFAINNCFTVWLILRAYGAAMPYSQVLGLIPALDVILSLPLSPANVGLQEVVFLNALTPWGVSAGAALAIGYTRMFGLLSRAAVGGVLFALGRRNA